MARVEVQEQAAYTFEGSLAHWYRPLPAPPPHSSLPPAPPTTQLIQAQEGVEEVPQARAGASLPPPSLFFIWQVNNLNFKPTSAGEQDCKISNIDLSLY